MRKVAKHKQVNKMRPTTWCVEKLNSSNMYEKEQEDGDEDDEL